MNKLREDDILRAHITDKQCKCFNKNIQTETGFLDLRQQSIAYEISRNFCVPFKLFGGYEEAERKKLYFFPNYINEPSNNIKLINITYKGIKQLTHRDFLGSILSLGLKREKIGDIIVFENGCQIIIENDIADFVYSNLSTAGKSTLNLSVTSIDNIKLQKQNVKLIKDTVMSLRLDAVISSAFSCSRSDAAKHIINGSVYVNDLLVQKTDKLVCEGVKLILRGKGKAILKSVGDLSKKGRINIEIVRYI